MSKILAANWKMNHTCQSMEQYFEHFLKGCHNVSPIWFFLPSLFLDRAHQLLNNHPNIYIGSQNIHHELQGSFTGEVSIPMLQSIHIHHVLIGHSERRHSESQNQINQKLRLALDSHFHVLYCIGEQKDERKLWKRALENQLKGVSQHPNLMIAYEPIWAIGTGNTASIEEIIERHTWIKAFAETPMPVLYGGSVDLKNALQIVSQPMVDGLLIGKASLDPNNFLEIIHQTIDNQNLYSNVY
jgi:triosephosphate isomerase